VSTPQDSSSEAGEPWVSRECEVILTELLNEARQLGFLGQGPVREQIARSLAFSVLAHEPPGLAVDLGSGGGLPGLVLAAVWPTSQFLLVDSNQRRTRWLSAAANRLGVAGRCEIACDRAENVARGARRFTADLVTARSFAPPGPTAECAAPLLKPGGNLLVAEPPMAGLPSTVPDRWPASGLAVLGLELEKTAVIETRGGPVSISCLTAISECPPAYPRRVGVPFKRHLF
jgi:16S rRNA (guanine527-N7)-methyltransferase